MVKKVALGIVVLAVIAIGLLFWQGTSDEAVIRQKFKTFEECIAKDSGEGTTRMALKMESLKNLFADQCDFEVKDTVLAGTYTPTEIAQKAIWGRKQFSRVRLGFYDLQVEVLSPEKAKAVFTVRLTGNRKSGERLAESREMEADIVKVEKRWKFTAFRIVDVFEK